MVVVVVCLVVVVVGWCVRCVVYCVLFVVWLLMCVVFCVVCVVCREVFVGWCLLGRACCVLCVVLFGVGRVLVGGGFVVRCVLVGVLSVGRCVRACRLLCVAWCLLVGVCCVLEVACWWLPVLPSV